MMIVLVTFPNREKAREITRQLVEERLAACATLLPGAESVYRWEGKVQVEDEVQAMLKTTRARLPQLTERLRALHPYEVPEILALPVETGLSAYLEWVVASCAASEEAPSAEKAPE